MSGEQFALPEAVARLREVRRSAPSGRLLTISGADPLNLVGIVTPGERVAAVRRNRIVFEDGVPLAALESGEIRRIGEYPADRTLEVERALVRRGVSQASPLVGVKTPEMRELKRAQLLARVAGTEKPGKKPRRQPRKVAP
jgi:hypothetical protein